MTELTNDPTANLTPDHFYLYKKIEGKLVIYGEGTPDPRAAVQRQNSMHRTPSGKGVKFMKGAELKEKYGVKPKKPRAKKQQADA